MAIYLFKGVIFLNMISLLLYFQLIVGSDARIITYGVVSHDENARCSSRYPRDCWKEVNPYTRGCEPETQCREVHGLGVEEIYKHDDYPKPIVDGDDHDHDGTNNLTVGPDGGHVGYEAMKNAITGSSPMHPQKYYKKKHGNPYKRGYEHVTRRDHSVKGEEGDDREKIVNDNDYDHRGGKKSHRTNFKDMTVPEDIPLRKGHKPSYIYMVNFSIHLFFLIR